jgi:hypothetical protein
LSGSALQAIRLPHEGAAAWVAKYGVNYIVVCPENQAFD